MTIFIGGAWPYANGSLHLGHIAGLLPGDILARYFRLKGEKVLYVSGSDCHGTPISIRAAKEKVTPHEIAIKYHKEFTDCFKKLGFSYDLYTSTEQPNHFETVQNLFLELYEKGFIYKKAVEQTYCENCNQFLPDRYVEGICPHCGGPARGDQCDNCSSILDPLELLHRKCSVCGSEPTTRSTEHFYFALSKFQNNLQEYLNNSKGWRENAVKLTQRYLNEGLKDRAATRDLPWGIDVPLEGYSGKKIYVWIEAVCGYLSASIQWSQYSGEAWEEFWSENSTAYYVHGKDNIPFHSLILPALLLGSGKLHLPDKIISSEYLTIEGKKLSTSRNWAVWVPYVLENYNPDAIRYFLIANGPEKRDADFSWREFINSNNSELLGTFGNFVNRTLVFIQKSFGGKIPEGKLEDNLKFSILKLYNQAGTKIEAGEFKSAIDDIFSFIRNANKYFDTEQPWLTIKSDPSKCSNTLFNCVQIITNISNLLSPFLPLTCEKINKFLNIDRTGWHFIALEPLKTINPPEILFERIDKSKIQEELEKLGIWK